MAKTNAQRQADFRKRGKAARAQFEGIGEFGLTKADEAVLTRLFGPRLVLTDKMVREFAEESAAVAKGVDTTGPMEEAAVSVLLHSIVHDGLGGMPLGWSLESDGEWTRLQVHVLKPASAMAA